MQATFIVGTEPKPTLNDSELRCPLHSATQISIRAGWQGRFACPCAHKINSPCASGQDASGLSAQNTPRQHIQETIVSENEQVSAETSAGVTSRFSCQVDPGYDVFSAIQIC